MTHPTPEYVELIERLREAARAVRIGAVSTTHSLTNDWLKPTDLGAAADALEAQSRAYVALAERVREMERIGSDLIAQASDYYTARNGKLCSIEGDDGEKCWIVPFEPFEELRAALNLQSTREQETALSQQEGSKAS